MSTTQFLQVNPSAVQKNLISGSTHLERMLEFTKRAFDSDSLEKFYFFLTNDLRAIAEFDRCSLIVHMGGRSRLAAINNQPVLDERALFHEKMSEVARGLKGVDHGLFLPKSQESESLGADAWPQESLQALRSYMAFAGCEFLAVIPLTHQQSALGHLVLEFFPGTRPNIQALSGLMRFGHLWGETLAQKWILDKKPSTKSLVSLDTQDEGAGLSRLTRKLLIAAGVLALATVLLFLIPVSATVGGEAEVVPRDIHVAFCKIDGLIESINVKEGESVNKSDVLATLDPKELDYKIQSAQTEFQVLTEQLLLLRSSSEKDPAKLAESRLVELKRRNAWLDLKYYEWQKQFLNIVAPVSGIVTTKQIESLKGKKLKAGESFCDIAIPAELWVEVLVPDDRIASVAVGQVLRLYLNNDPLTPQYLAVQEVAPCSEAHERLGNVYRVRAPFPDAEKLGKVGMKGIGKIDTKDANLWYIVSQRLATLWNRLSLYF